MVTLGIRGADSGKFDFDPVDDGVTTGPHTLKFKAKPDFEKPADADKDNVYEVTITATDGNANMATRDVKVTVTNAEEAGTVKLSQPTPRVGLAITASYTDDDGGLASATWQWWRTESNNVLGAAPVFDENSRSHPTLDESMNAWDMIAGATSATYTPVEGPDADAEGKSDLSDVGRYLAAVVSYTDAKQNLVEGVFSEEAKDMAGLVSANPVAVDTRNRAPVFRNDDGDA